MKKTSPSSIICSGTDPDSRSTNCGSTATKNAIVFGFVMPTTNPSPSWRQCERGSAPDIAASAARLRCRIAWTPRNIRYSAPATFTIVNSTTDRATMPPTPRATRPMTGSSPNALPSTLSNPPMRPRARARPIVNSTLGPGMTISTRAATMNASRLSGGTTVKR